MYKIYVNERPLHLVSVDEAKERMPGSLENPVIPYLRKKSQLRKAKKWLENNEFASMTFYHPKPEKILKDFIKIVTPYYAGGGLIRNKDGQYFFMFRRGHWDLPKGKIDPGETIEEASVREVLEETGLNARIVKEMITTYHTYIFKQSPAIKITKWFLMETDDLQFNLQAEEGIEKALWTDLNKAIKELQPMYVNIQEVILEGMEF